MIYGTPLLQLCILLIASRIIMWLASFSLYLCLFLFTTSGILCQSLNQEYKAYKEGSSKEKIPKDEWVS